MARSTELAARLSLTFPLLADPERATIRAYGVDDPGNGTAWPAVFVVGTDGRVAWRSLAETYRVRPMPAVLLDALPR